jgi:hypothetical protein
MSCACKCYGCNIPWLDTHCYKPKFLCIPCRRVFKRTIRFEDSPPKYDPTGRWCGVLDLTGLPSKFHSLDTGMKCSECSLSAIYIGSTFRAPKQTDDKAWKRVEKMIEDGVEFIACVGEESRLRKSLPEFVYKGWYSNCDVENIARVKYWKRRH